MPVPECIKEREKEVDLSMSAEGSTVLSLEDLWRLRALEAEFRLAEERIRTTQEALRALGLAHAAEVERHRDSIDALRQKMSKAQGLYGTFFADVQKRYDIGDAAKVKIDWVTGEVHQEE